MRAITITAALMAALLLPGCGGPGPAAPAAGAGQAASPQQEAEPQTRADDAKLFESSCSVCHPIVRATEYDGDESWNEVVTEMIDEKGARISPADRGRIIAHLNAAYPRS